ncbi:hypothetical protein KKH39_01680 [Patescibacteria group bacterium]|nr:hypothetical protein [Patescibacteria group bacterium]
MTLEKIQNHLALLFFSILVVLQALVFVAVRANDNSQDLQAVFVNPSIGQSLEAGEAFYIQAQLSSDKYQDLVGAYFVWYDLATNQRLNFEADKQSDGTWKAQAILDVSQFVPGTYYLQAVVPIFDKGIFVENEVSIPQVVNIVGELAASLEGVNSTDIFQVAFISPMEGKYYPNNINLDIDVQLTGNEMVYEDFDMDVARFTVRSFEEANKVIATASANYTAASYTGTGVLDLSPLLAGTYYLALEVQAISTRQYITVASIIFNIIEPSLVDQEDILNLQINVLSPRNNSTVSGDLQIDVVPSYQLQLPSERVAVIINNNARILLELAADGHLKKTIDTTAQLNGEPVYPNGDYTLSFMYYLEDQTVIDPIELATTTIIINNINEPEEKDPVFLFNAPQDGQVISQNSFTLNVQTNFETEAVKYEIYDSQNPSITIGETTVPKTDGLNWVREVILDDYLPDGENYVLHVEALYQGETIASDLSIVLDRIEEQAPIPAETNLYLHGISTNLEPQSVLIGSGNILGDLSFVFHNTATEEEIISPAQLINCDQSVINNTIRQEIQNLGSTYCFYKVVAGDLQDDLENGNYEISLSYNGDTIINSQTKLISYFNSENQSTEEVEEEEVIVKIFGPIPIVEAQNQRLLFYVATSINPIDYDQILSFWIKDSQDREVLSGALSRSNWDNAAVRGIFLGDNPETPYLFDTFRDTSGNSILSQDGTYKAYVELALNDSTIIKSNELTFEIINSYLAGYAPTDQEELEDQVEENKQPQQIRSGGGSDVAIGLYTSCLEAGIIDENTCLRFRAVMDSLDNRCINQDIYEEVACEDYLNRIEVDKECQDQSIIDKEQCKDYLLEKYGSQVDCQLVDTGLCTDILRNSYLNRLVVAQKRSIMINEAIAPLIGKNLEILEVSNELENKGISLEDLLPIKKEDSYKVLVAPSTKETVLEDTNKLTVINQAVMIADSDGDGLVDDLEGYYGTDPNNSDSDGDGYSDGMEINNGYDPLGPGALVRERTNLDKIILSKINLEQPKEKSKKIDKSFKVASVNSQEKEVELNGQADPNTWVNIYLYSSLPLVMTTKTDASGNWSYDIKHSLAEGHHRVYVTVNDDTGKIVKQSQPISFLIKEAQAVTADSYFDESEVPDSVNNLLVYYILGAAFLIFFALGIILFLHRGKRPDLEA